MFSVRDTSCPAVPCHGHRQSVSTVRFPSNQFAVAEGRRQGSDQATGNNLSQCRNNRSTCMICVYMYIYTWPTTYRNILYGYVLSFFLYVDEQSPNGSSFSARPKAWTWRWVAFAASPQMETHLQRCKKCSAHWPSMSLKKAFLALEARGVSAHSRSGSRQLWQHDRQHDIENR